MGDEMKRNRHESNAPQVEGRDTDDTIEQDRQVVQWMERYLAEMNEDKALETSSDNIDHPNALHLPRILNEQREVTIENFSSKHDLRDVFPAVVYNEIRR